MASSKVHSGKCLCGAVTFTVEPVSPHIGACHCGMCRRWTSGAYMGIDCGTSLKIIDDQSLGIFKSSDWAERGFCAKCGSSLFYRLNDGQAYVSVHAVDGLDDVKLTDEVFIDEKPDYYAFAQDTKKMTGPELFALFEAEDQ